MFTTIQSHYTLNSIQMQMQILRQSIGFHTYFFFSNAFAGYFDKRKLCARPPGHITILFELNTSHGNNKFMIFVKNRHQFFASLSIC